MSVKKRIQSVDILRGVTIMAMILVNTPGDWNHVYSPLLHAEWHGLTPTDLIFPYFLFIVGISIYFAYKHKTNSATTLKKIIIRSFRLIGLGLFLNLFLPYIPFLVDLDSARLPGVLQRIGIVFFVSAILYLNCNWKVLLGISALILIGYWLFMGYVPLPNGMEPTLNRAPNNWANYIDLKILGSHMWQPDYDPEGMVSTLPSIVSCVSGVLVGKLLDREKPLRFLFLIALLLLICGYMFSAVFPINKALWSSSFVLVTSGWGTLILAVIYYFKDVKQYQFGDLARAVGVNAITVYFLSSFISKCMYLIKIDDTHNLHSWIFQTFFIDSFLSLKLSSLLYALGVVLFYLLLAHWMSVREVFIKV